MGVLAPEVRAPLQAAPPSRSVPRWLVPGLIALLAVPLLVAIVSLRHPTWYPTLDLAMTELRVRDVGTSHTPLVGLPGRIGSLAEQGSHPGPLSFYALAPTYKALGSSAWSLQVATIVLTFGGMVTCLLLARRRGGARVIAGVAVVLVGLGVGYGFEVLTEPWNPYMPLFWWLAFVLACWGVAVGDMWLLPVAVAVGTFCAQTHLPYVGLTVGLGIGALGLGLLECRSRGIWRTVRRPLAVALLCGVVLWSPVVADQLFVDPPNGTLIYRHFKHPPEEAVGLRTGLHVMLVHLDLRQMTGLAAGGSGSLVDSSYDPAGTVVPGILLLLAWGAAVVASWRLGLRKLLRLHLVLAGALVLGVVSAGNIFGIVWFYLTLWAWALSAMVLAATGATLLAVVEPRLSPPRRAALQRGSLVALLAVVVVGVTGLTIVATGIDEPAPELSRGLGMVVGPTAAALRAGRGAATGPDGRYVVTWSDPVYFGSQGYGLVSELERDGLHMGVRDWAKVPVTRHRVIPPEDVTAVVNFAAGSQIAHWRSKPGVVEVAHVDPRTAAERAEHAAIETELTADLRASHMADLVPLLSTNLFGASLDPRLSHHQRDDIARLLFLGEPLSVFIAPPDVDPL